jgi:hypothetical protein
LTGPDEKEIDKIIKEMKLAKLNIDKIIKEMKLAKLNITIKGDLQDFLRVNIK